MNGAPAATPASAWQAAGVRHELLMRILPALRHDMAGPLSVTRMGHAVLKRNISAVPADIAQCLRRLEQTDEQLTRLLDAVRALGRWEVESRETADAGELVSAGLDVSRSVLDLHGMQLNADELLALSGWPAMQPARALYGVVGALSYLQDSAEGPAVIHVRPDADGLMIKAVPTGAAFAEDAVPLSRTLRIDSQALQCLADNLSWPMEIHAGRVRLAHPQGPTVPAGT